jgi:hypothetical protein
VLVAVVDFGVGIEARGDGRHGQGGGVVAEEPVRANDVQAVLDFAVLLPPRA